MREVGRFGGVVDESQLVRFGVAREFLGVVAVVKIFDFAKVGVGGKDFYVIAFGQKEKSAAFVLGCVKERAIGANAGV